MRGRSRPRVRAVVLCAGLGRRLRPLTEFVPKALLPAAGAPVVAHALRELLAAGCESVALNLHHLGEQIQKRFGAAFSGMGITYSPEEKLLGTLGALGPLRDFLAPADLIVVINGDSLCRWPLRRLLRLHQRRGVAATLLLAKHAAPAEFGGGVLVGDKGRILSLRGGRPAGKKQRLRVFAGAHVFAPSLLEGATTPLRGEPADFVGQLYQPLIDRGRTVLGVETGRIWHDLGTPRRYLRGVRDWARGSGPLRLLRRRWVAPGAEVGRNVRVQRSVVESGARIEPGSVLDGALIFPGARIGRGSEIRSSIIGPGAMVPPGTSVTARLVTTARADLPGRPEDSVVGGLVYSRMEERH